MTSSRSLVQSSPLLSLLFAGTLLATTLAAGCSSDGDGDEGDDASGGGSSTGGATSTGGSSDAGGSPAAGGSDTAAGGTSGGEMDYPADTSQATIEAYLAAETYKEAPWVGETELRVPTNAANPHKLSVRVYYNTLGAEAAPPPGEEAGAEAAMNAMSVKEMYDDTDTLIGKAVRWKVGEGTTSKDWVSYCNAPADSTACTGSAEPVLPIYKDGGFNTCGTCHGNTSFFAPHP